MKTPILSNKILLLIGIFLLLIFTMAGSVVLTDLSGDNTGQAGDVFAGRKSFADLENTNDNCSPPQISFLGRCECPDGLRKKGDTCITPSACPSPQISIFGQCLCPKGQNKEGDNCINADTSDNCSPGEIWNKVEGQCKNETEDRNQCPAGEKWDSYKGNCICATPKVRAKNGSGLCVCRENLIEGPMLDGIITCKPRSCSSGFDCPSSDYLCLDSVCVIPNKDGQCEADYECFRGKCVNNQCKENPECYSDYDCGKSPLFDVSCVEGKCVTP